MKTGYARNAGWMALVVVLVATASVVSLVSSYRSEVASHRRVLADRGQVVLEALRAGILAHGRMGRYRGDRLSIIFEELAQSSDIVSLALRAPNGELLASGGDPAEIPDKTPGETEWTDARLIKVLDVEFSAECRQGPEGRSWQARESLEDWSTFSGGRYKLIAVLNASALRTAIQRHQVQLFVSIGGLLMLLSLSSWIFMQGVRRSELAAELEHERERARRQQQIAQLGAGLAHETKNPLGIVRGLAQSIGAQADRESVASRQAASIVDEVDRVIGSVNSFLALARPPEAHTRAIALDPFFESFLPLVQMDSLAANVNVCYQPSGLAIEADENLLRRALLNLILNALIASDANGSVSIAAVQAGSHVSLRVRDSGCGIEPENLARITEPYFSRFPNGSGLGLSIVEQIANAHGWVLTISSTRGEGTEVALENIRSVQQS